MLNHFSLLACNSSLLANFFFKSSISEKCHWEARKQQYSRLHCLCIKWITDAEGPLMGKGWKKWCDCSLIIKQICYLWSALWTEGFLGGSDSKESACSVGDPGSIPASGRSPGEGNGNPLQYSRLENPMDTGAWQATFHGISKSQTRLSDFTFFFFLFVDWEVGSLICTLCNYLYTKIWPMLSGTWC